MLPTSVPQKTAVTAAARSAALVLGLARADRALLEAGLDDVLHVPYRRVLVPGYDAVTQAATDAGAYGATLSGSGSTLVAIAPAERGPAVEAAMTAAWRATGVRVETFRLGRAVGGYEVSMAPSRAVEIHKFGGASVADATAIARAVAIIQGQRPHAMVIVVSAMARVTDALLEIAAQAVRGEAEACCWQRLLRDRHVAAARVLLGRDARSEALRRIDEEFTELERIAAGLVIVGELTARTSDYLVARGERLSARLLTAGLEAAGVKATLVHALDVIRSDASFGHASSPNLRRDTAPSARGARAAVEARRRAGGACSAATPPTPLATLGRGGSDYRNAPRTRARSAPGLLIEGRARSADGRPPRRA